MMGDLLGSKVDKPSQIFVKTSSAMAYIKSDIQNMRHREQMILSCSIYEKRYLQCSLERVLEAIQVSSL